jgi:hypothetical protein
MTATAKRPPLGYPLVAGKQSLASPHPLKRQLCGWGPVARREGRRPFRCLPCPPGGRHANRISD